MAAETYYHNLIRRLSPTDAGREWAAYQKKKATEQIADGLYIGPIQQLGITRLRRAVAKRIRASVGRTHVDLVAGGPPCQGYSTAGLRRAHDARNRMPDHFLRFVGWLNPKAVLIENVAGFRIRFQRDDHEAGAVAVLEQLRRIGKAGYIAGLLALNAAHYGVPQSRPRTVILGLRKDIADQLGITDSELWYSKPGLQASPTLDLRPVPTVLDPRTVRDAFYGLDDAADDATYAEMLARELPVPTHRDVTPSRERTWNHKLRRHCERVEQRFRLYQILRDMHIDEDILSHAARSDLPERDAVEVVGRITARCNGFPRSSADGLLVLRSPIELASHIVKYATKKHSQRALSWDKPSYTVMTLPDDLAHPAKARTLTVREMARLQSFPDDFEFMGKETTGGHMRKVEVPQYTQVGNAVPPLLAHALGLHIRRLLDAAAEGERKAK